LAWGEFISSCSFVNGTGIGGEDAADGDSRRVELVHQHSHPIGCDIHGADDGMGDLGGECADLVDASARPHRDHDQGHGALLMVGHVLANVSVIWMVVKYLTIYSHRMPDRALDVRHVESVPAR